MTLRARIRLVTLPVALAALAVPAAASETAPLRGIGTIDQVFVGLYLVAVILIGAYYARRQKTQEDFLLGGRRVNPIASGISIIVTLLSLISYLALVGETVKYGPVYAMAVLVSLPFIYVIIAFFLIPRFMKLPITSAYEILEKPLGLEGRLAGSAIFTLTRIAWMALLVYLSAKTLGVMMNWGERFIVPTILVLGIVTIVYSALGGFRAAVATGVLKFALLFLGAILTVVFVSIKMGGVAAWFPTGWAAHWTPFAVFSLDPKVRTTLLGVMLTSLSWWVCTAGSDQLAIQRYLSTRNVRAARKAFLVNNLAEVVLTVFLAFVGFAVLGFFQANPGLMGAGQSVTGEADFLFPHLIANILPRGVAGLLLAGVISTVLVSFSSGMNSTAAVVATDFVARFRRRPSRPEDGLRTARLVTLVVGLLVLALATLMNRVPGNIIEVTNRSNGLFVAPLFNLFFMALFVKRASGLGTIFGSAYGFFTAFLIAFWAVLTGHPGPSFQWIIPVAFLSSVSFSLLFSLILGRERKRGRAALGRCLVLAAPLPVILALIIFLT
jgi:SSS family solute:Na+ symporter